MNRGVVIALVSALLSALPSVASAQRGVSPRTLSLPSGPGSVEGLGSSFEPSPQSGGASYSVPFAMPQAVGGFAPSLSMGYAAGGGATEVGHGWSLPIPSIRVRTEDGIPRYDASDTFAIAGGGGDGDLVSMGGGVYRLRFEGAFIRVRRDGDRWEARQPDGITHWFGEDATARDGETGRTSRWLITRSTDRHGHSIRYEYTRQGNRGFLSTIRYGGEGAAEVKVELGYEARPDVLVSYQSGDPITLDKRLITVRLTRGGELVATYTMRYATDPGLSRLESVTMTGTDGTTALPTLRFQYGAVDFSAMRVATVANAPGMGLQSTANELVDLNGDGAADLLVTAPGRYLGYLNEAGERFGSQYTLDTAPSVSLDQTGVQVADMDGDASIDIVAKVGVASDGFRFYPGGDARSFGAVRAFSSNRSYTFEDPELRLVDLDFDRRTDVLFSTPTGLYASYNTGGDFTAPEALPTVDPAQPIRFNDAAMRLADINGDRLQDLVQLRSGSLVYWPSRGRGRYAAPQTMTGVPTVPDVSALQLVDLTGDGLTDIVRVGVNVVEAWIHQANGSYSPMPRMVNGVPERGPNTSVRFIDMNGNGSTDIVWVDVSGSPATAWRYLDVISAAAPNQLTQIDNGLGLVTTIRYRASAAYAADDARAGRPWTTRLPNGMLVVSEIVEDVGLGVLETTRFNYHDGLYHGLTREFRGFGRAEKIEVGDAQQPTLVSALEFDHGVMDEARKGMLLRSERRTEGGAIFDRTTSTIEVVNAGMGEGGVALRWARPRRSETAVFEQTMTPKTTRTETDYDDWGNVIETREFGLVEGDNVAVGNDERVTRSTWAINEQDWLLRFKASMEVVDLAGTRASMSRQYYDGEAFVGLPLGQVARGDVTRQEAWRGPGVEDWIPQGGNRYDADGNVTETRDGDGRVRRIEWDPTTHAYPVTERALVSEGRELVWTATYDHRFGRVLTATGPDGTTNRYGYDVLGRISATWVAAREDEPPTVRYGYVLTAPLSRIEVAELVAYGSRDYRTRVTLMDASGRARVSIDPGPEGRAIVKTVEELGVRGWTTRTFHPFESTTTGVSLLTQGEWVSASRYDALGRQIAATFVDGARAETRFAPFETTEFDPSDLESGSPREGRPELTRRDGLGRIVENVVELPMGRDVTTMRYDVLGNVIARTDPMGLVQGWRFDGLSRRTELNDPNGGRRSAEYDNSGNLVRWRSARGHTLTARYDGVGRLVARDADGDGSEEISYEFDRGCENGAGRLCAIREPGWTVLTDYDSRGSAVRTEFSALGQRWEIREEFGPAGELLRHTFPDSSSLEVRYDGAGRVASAGDLVRTVKYNARGDVERIEYGNGVVEVREFDVRGRPKAIRYTDRNGAVLEDLEYRFDATTTLREVIDRRAGRTPTDDRGEVYRHDARGHLIEATGSWGWMRWQYDAADRMTERTSSVSALNLGTIAYGPMNQRQPYAPRQMGATRLEWDEAGNVANIDGVAARFNARDLPELIPLPNGGRLESTFDANGVRRVERVRGERESTTVYLTAFEHIRDGKLIRTIPLAGRTVWVSDEGVARQQAQGCDSRPASRDGESVWPVLWLLLVLPAGRTHARRRSVSTIAVIVAVFALGCMAVPGVRPLRTNEGKVVLSGIDGSTLGSVVDVAGTYIRQLRYPGGFPRVDIAPDEFSVYSGSQRTTHPDMAAIGPRVLNVRLGIWLSVDSAVFDGVATNPYTFVDGDAVSRHDMSGREWRAWLARVVRDGQEISNGATLLAAGLAGLSLGAPDPVTRGALVSSAMVVLEFAGFAATVSNLTTAITGIKADGTTASRSEQISAALWAGIGLIPYAGPMLNTARSFSAGGAQASRTASAPARQVGRVRSVGEGRTLADRSAQAAVRRTGPAGRSSARQSASTSQPASRQCMGGSCMRAGECFSAGTIVDTEEGEVPIELVQLGDRIGSTSETCREEYFADWLQIELVAYSRDEVVSALLLRPREWVKFHRLEPGATLDISISEIGTIRRAFIVAVADAPRISAGTRCPVTGVFRRRNVEIGTLTLESGEQILVTRRHRFFSTSHWQWRAAEQLSGDVLQTRTGRIKSRGYSINIGERVDVWNLEVAQVHEYFVGRSHLRTHNSYASAAAQRLRELGLENVELAGASFNSGERQLLQAGFSRMSNTATGRRIFRNERTGAEVHYDSGNALAPGQTNHWHIRNRAGENIDRSGRIVDSSETAGHIPAAR